MGNASFDAMFSVFSYIFEFIPRVKLFSVIMVIIVKMLSKMMMAMLIVSKENVRSWSCMVIPGQYHEYCIILTWQFTEWLLVIDQSWAVREDCYILRDEAPNQARSNRKREKNMFEWPSRYNIWLVERSSVTFVQYMLCYACVLPNISRSVLWLSWHDIIFPGEGGSVT